MFFSSCSAVVVLTAALGAPLGSLEEAATDLASEVRQVLNANANSGKSIRLGAFEGPPGNGSGAKLAKLLEEDFGKNDIKVVNSGGFRIGGNIEISQNNGRLVMVIEAELFSATGRKVHTLVKRIVMDRDAAIAASGATADLSLAATEPAAAGATTPAPNGGTPANPAANPANPANPAANPNPANPAANPNPANPANPAANPNPANPAANPNPANPAANPNPANPAANPNPANPAVAGNPANPANPANPGNPGVAVGTGNPAGTNPGGTVAAGERPRAEQALPKAEATKQILTSLENPSAQIKKVEQVVKTPTGGVQVIVQQVVKASATSPYGIEVLRGPNSKAFAPGEVTLEDAPGGQVSFVQIAPTDVFGIRIHNESKRPVGCALTIDGINVFAFSQIPQWRSLGKMVIGPGGGFIRGWHRTDEFSNEFVITKYADSAAAKLGITKGVGTITAVFFETFDPNDTARGDSPTEAVGIGKEVAAKYLQVPVRFGDPVAVVTVRYNRPDLPIGDAAVPPNAQGNPGGAVNPGPPANPGQPLNPQGQPGTPPGPPPGQPGAPAGQPGVVPGQPVKPLGQQGAPPGQPGAPPGTVVPPPPGTVIPPPPGTVIPPPPPGQPKP